MLTKVSLLDENGHLLDFGGEETPTLLEIYPVGSVYMNNTLVDPDIMFGGTWERIMDVFLLGAGDTYVAGTTGGAASISYTPAGTVGDHTLTVDEIPAHNHSFTGTAVTSRTQSANHYHSITDYYATTTGAHTITVAQIGSHAHSFYDYWGVYDDTSGYYGVHAHSTSGNVGGSTSGAGSGNSHTHSGANTSTTRTTNGISANHTHSFTASGTVGNNGSGNAHNHGFTGTAATIDVLPPYTTVYMWKRIA